MLYSFLSHNLAYASEAEMSNALSARRRVKLSVTVAPDLLKAVDSFLTEHPELDRSKVVDEALSLWYARQQAEAMERQYASPPSPQEQQERAAWRRIQQTAAKGIFGSR
jgi:hypothetical protein